LDNQLQPVFRPFRDLLYSYHREGMDTMTEDAAASRRLVAAQIEKLKSVHQAKPASYNLQVFFNAKYNELVELFKQGDPQEKTKVFNTLQIIDPGHISQYQGIMRDS
jgi:O6-methylguanine-DNA--protein-cysteine methyltransferase